MAATGSIPPNDLARLARETNFTVNEIRKFYRNASSNQKVTKTEFGRLCFEHGVRSETLVSRLWSVLDTDSDGELSYFEVIRGLNPLLRGTKEEVAGMFFELYDINGDHELDANEIISVYSDMVSSSEVNRRRMLSFEQRRNISDWMERHLSNTDKHTMDKSTFITAIMEMEGKTKKKSTFWCRKTFYYLSLTAFFEIGTSFSLPAMGALSSEIKEIFGIDDSDIGALTGAYFIAAMVGPLVAGIFMDKYGPNRVVIGATTIVTLGASLQALAVQLRIYWLLIVGRLLLGFGGDMVPFNHIEILGKLFPDYFGMMAGFRNMIQSKYEFLAFVLLPLWSNKVNTSFALWMCAFLGLCSIVSSIIVHVSMKNENDRDLSAEEESDQGTIVKNLRAFSRATSPKITGSWHHHLPLSFYLAVLGIRSQYFAPLCFTSFSNEIYKNKFGLDAGLASFFTGCISLVAGVMGPHMGKLSDTKGYRASTLSFLSFLSMSGFLILGVADSGIVPVIMANILFSIQYGYGDTVAFMTIRFITGPKHAGIGYGVFGVLGNLIHATVLIVGGHIILHPNGYEEICVYFGLLMFLSTMAWVGVRVLEGDYSLVETPVDKMIETQDEDLKLAALSYVAGTSEKSEKNAFFSFWRKSSRKKIVPQDERTKDMSIPLANP